MMKKVFLSTWLLAGWLGAGAQEAVPTASEDAAMKKGTCYFYWGYNRAIFSKSDIKFVSPDAVFTLHDVKAKDRPSPFSFEDYFYNVTIPQFNLRLGYAIKKNFTVSLGYDHMKYVMVTNQVVGIDGQIAYTPENGKFAGCYKDTTIQLSPDFLRYEHTNGLNYMSADAEYHMRVWKSKNDKFQFTFVPGVSLAFMYPRSDVDVFDVEGVNVFHVAGYGTSLEAGFKLSIGKHFFMQWNNRSGFINLPDVLCRDNGFDAQQYFWFYQSAFWVGTHFRLCKEK